MGGGLYSGGLIVGGLRYNFWEMSFYTWTFNDHSDVVTFLLNICI